jgi:hypothetical protein
MPLKVSIFLLFFCFAIALDGYAMLIDIGLNLFDVVDAGDVGD